MENKEDVMPGEQKKRNAAGIILLVLSAYSALSFVLLLIIGKLIPTPLAEYIAFAYVYGKGGKTALCALFVLLYAAAALFAILTFREESRRKLFILVPAAVLVFADLAVNAYAFLAARGYQWIYIVCAVLDGVMLFCMLYGQRGKKKGA